jgi:hypothetical protein
MSRPDHFFKYVSADRVKQIIRDGTLRWSAASAFNDPFDIQFDMHVEYDREKLIDEATQETWAFYSGAKQFIPANQLGRTIQALSALPGTISRQEFTETMREGIVEALVAQEQSLPKLHAGLREGLSPVQVLCLSETPSNLLMWSHYAKNHTGAVLKLSCISSLASPWGAAKPVQYRKNMPLLFDHQGLFLFLTGQAAIDNRRIAGSRTSTISGFWRRLRSSKTTGSLSLSPRLLHAVKPKSRPMARRL